MGQQVNVYKELVMKPGAIVKGALGPLFDPNNRTYYVNNVTGSSTADGLSWNSAVDQISAAITLSEAYRAIPASTNEFIRNTIVVQGTGDYLGTEGGYDALTDLGEHYNLIGLGTPSGKGYGEGLVRIGKDTGETTGGMENDTGTYAGVYVANVQFQSGSSPPCFSAGTLQKCMFEDCSFYVAPAISALPLAYFRVLNGATACTIRRCITGGTAAWIDRPTNGIDLSVGDPTYFAFSMIEDCVIGGSRGIVVGGACTGCRGTVVRNNMIGSIGQGVMDIGIWDASTGTDITGGLITYINNMIQATHPAQITNQWSRFINNYAVLTEQTASVILYSGNAT